MDLRRLEMAPALTKEIAAAMSSSQFVNFGSSGEGGRSAAATGSDDILRVVQTLLAAQIVTGGRPGVAGRADEPPVEIITAGPPGLAPTAPRARGR